jgi:hypothetical protein
VAFLIGLFQKGDLVMVRFKSETLDVEFENGAIVYIYNAPDGLWRFRLCDLDTRPVMGGGGVMLQTKIMTKPSWEKMTFATSDEAIQFFSRELKSSPRKALAE